MIEDREFSATDHPAKLRRYLKAILIPAVLAPWVGFLISYAVPARYTSQSRIVVETKRAPPGDEQPVVPEDASQYLATLERQVLSPNRLRPMIDRMGLATGGVSREQVLKRIWQTARILPAVKERRQNQTGDRENPGEGWEVAGFYVEYTGSTPKEAQQVCSELTSMLLEEDLHSRQHETETMAESERQLDEAKRHLDEQDHKLASFKKRHTGQLPEDSEANTSMLMVSHAQLNTLSQWISLTQQNKSNAEAILAGQPASQKSPPSPATPASPAALEKQLSDLESQLLQLQAEYTENHPDVIKTKAEIAQIKQKLAEANAAAGTGADPHANSNVEPPEIRRLRLQVEQYEQTIQKATREQKRIQEQAKLYQGRVLLSSSLEQQYQQLTADYDRAQELYADLLAKNGEVENRMGGPPQSEWMRLSNAANLPATPRFPNRRLFAAGGLGSGLALGLGITLWLKVRDRTIRPARYW